MNLHRAALPLLLAQSVESQRQINGVPSTGNFILSEYDVDLGSILPDGISTLKINSPVPVTIQRFSDSDSLEGQQSVTSNMAKVLVTSNCDTSNTNVMPTVGEDPSDGSVSVAIGDMAADPDMDFLEPSSYSADWKYKNDFCGGNFPWGPDGDGGIPAPDLPVLTTCQSDVGCASADQFCELSMGVCDESGLHQGYCLTKPEVCGEIYSPVCGCDGVDYGNNCEAQVAGVSVSRMGKCADPPGQGIVIGNDGCEAGQCRGPDGECAEEVLCFEEPCDANPNPCGDAELCVNNRCGSQCTAVCVEAEIILPSEPGDGIGGPVYNPGSGFEGIVNPGTLPEGLPEQTVDFMPINGAEGIAASGPGATTTTATTVAASSNGSSASTTAATNAAPAEPSPSTDDGKSPTSAPFQDVAPGSSSAFGRSMSFCVATAFMAIAVLSVVFPGNGANNNLWGFGKVAVAAMAVSSIYSKTPSGTRGANIQKDDQHSKSFLAEIHGRALQDTCTYNVEVLIDGCEYGAEINAPAGRIVDVSIDDKTSVQDPNDECITDYKANLNFPTTEAIGLDLANNNIAPALERFDFRCMRAVIGRPFVDATGGSIQAMPMIPDSKQTKSCASSLSWAGSASEEAEASYERNATTSYGHLLMGEDWTQRALGEHSSVASFSAFSIALMTNQAPSDLVEAALKAGLDEVRHAKVSFDIASKLTGKEVGPGPLPPSSHEFGQDMTALALAVAREGCVDETLSAFAAALEVEHINAVLDDGLHDTLYSNIGRDTLAFIRDTLVTIAMDESNHSALAWRTLTWVCDVDANACESVHSDVFEGSSLERRFNQRAESPFGVKDLVLRSMGEEWNKILNVHRLARSSPNERVNMSICEEGIGAVGEDHSQSLLASVTENILHQVSCN